MNTNKLTQVKVKQLLRILQEAELFLRPGDAQYGNAQARRRLEVVKQKICE